MSQQNESSSGTRSLFHAGRLGKRTQDAGIAERLQNAIGELRAGAVAEPAARLKRIGQQPQAANQLEPFGIVHLAGFLFMGPNNV